ncbi:MAG: NfeD family protein [bacterium JZ-2024 1]
MFPGFYATLKRVGNIRKKIKLFFLLFLFSAGASIPDEETIYVLQVQDSINPFTSLYIRRGLALGQKNRATMVVILLDTPGGLVTTTRELIQKILDARVPVVIFIYPPGAHAGSAGAFLLMAADVAVMAPSTTVGSATPVSIGGVEGGSVPETLLKKATEDAAALMRSLAEKKNRNVQVAERFVTEAISLTETQALEQKIIDFIAEDTPDLLQKLHGHQIVKNGQTFVLETQGKKVKEIPMTARETFFSTISHPTVAYILLLIGMWGILYEFLHPGQYYPGILGAISLVLAFVALQNLPFSWGAIVLMVIGLLLIVAEIKTPGFGFLGIAGAGAFLIGSYLMFPSPFQVPWEIILTIGGIFIGFLLIVVPFVVRAHLRRPFVGKESLLEKIGEVVRDLTPEGQVLVEGELWKAFSLTGPVERGKKVLIRKVEGMKVLVEPWREETTGKQGEG